MKGRAQSLLLLVPVASLFSSCSYRSFSAECDHSLPGKMAKQAFLDNCLLVTGIV